MRINVSLVFYIVIARLPTVQETPSCQLGDQLDIAFASHLFGKDSVRRKVVNSVTQETLAAVWVLGLRDVPLKGFLSTHKSSLHSATCLESEDSPWHKETHSLITFYSPLSTTLSLIPTCSELAPSSLTAYLEPACSRLCVLFAPLSLQRDFLWNLGQLYRLILCGGPVLISFPFYSVLQGFQNLLIFSFAFVMFLGLHSALV